MPGETDQKIHEIVIQGEGGAKLALNDAPLFMTLGQRAGNPLITNRYFNPYRVAEDHRRVLVFWQSHGYFDAEVAEPEVKQRPDGTVDVTHAVRENTKYVMLAPEVLAAPEELAEAVKEEVPFEAGADVDLEKYRIARYAMAEVLQRHGYGHARVLSRAFVDRAAKKVTFYYYVDAGPKTHIGSLIVKGSHRVPADLVIERSGLRVGAPYDLERKEKAELDLLDGGNMASALVTSNVDTEFYFSNVPDTGGEAAEPQVDEAGNLVPRKLSDAIDVVINVVEAPRVQIKARAGVEGDPTRVDAIAGTELFFRDLLGPMHHVVAEGKLGYGYLWRDHTTEPLGLYGDAMLRYVHEGLFARMFDGRLTGRYRNELYPGYHLSEITAGPGGRAVLTRGVFLDIDVLYRSAKQIGFGPFDEATAHAASLPTTNDSHGLEADVGLTWDARNDPIEALKGHLLSLRGVVSPGGALGTHRYVDVLPDARVYFPIEDGMAIGVRAGGGFVVAKGDEGVPLGPRLFGGGAFGFRGFGYQRLAPSAASCRQSPTAPPVCNEFVVGGLSLAEASIEGRLLPERKPFGGIVFLDAGGATLKTNPFADGVSLAAGFGFRVRLWYVPVALDFSYRILKTGHVESPKSFDPFFVFLRLGEAF